MNKFCLFCEQEFEDKTSRKNKIYCSGNCRMRVWRKNNPNHKLVDAEYFQINKSKLQTARTKRHRERYKTEIQYRLKDILRSRLLKAIDKNLKSGSAIADLGCSIEEFKVYLESKFLPGMNWGNQGKGKDKWNIDHIEPLKDFDLTNNEELKNACYYTNLQPIWETDHYEKTSQEQ